MKVVFIKRNFYTKDDQTKYTITTLCEDIVNTCLVNRYTYNWFENMDVGEEVPADFCKLALYQTKEGMKARLHIEVEQ